MIPLRDEEDNVVPLHGELTDVLDQIGVSYEVILVDDGSADRTFERLAEIQRRDPKVRLIRFTRNFGQTAAFAAGFAEARGQYIVTLDGDLQNDPRDIPEMLVLARRKDIVSGWRRKRKDNFFTRYVPSALANWLLGIVTGVRLHDNGCSLKIYRAKVIKPLKLRPGMHRYFPALASQLGGRVAEVEVNHRPRQHGRSKYNLSRTFTVVSDLFQLRRLMREAIDPNRPMPRLYEIAEMRG
ncbi:MAG TPA: glycosyltransferase family 2 protein [Vicinamibacterales bacterium]|nr:glycosyltransferase family 2 protein [Vicinamibacterales bacterium]